MIAYAVLLAGGSGRRMESSQNKVFLRLRGVPAIVRAIAPFSALCAGVIVVSQPAEVEPMRELLTRYGFGKVVRQIVAGGDTRQASVANGLRALPADAQAVLVHDGARPLVTEAVIQRVLDSVARLGSGVPAIPVTDTIKRADKELRILETLDRESLYAMQTPQGFAVSGLKAAHERAAADGYLGTDDASLLEHAQMPVYLTQGDPENIKLTTPDDLYRAEAILTARAEREALQ